MALTNSAYNALPQRSNIQGFWRMEEESGTRYDESDNSNDLTDNNTVLYGTGKIGNAADFESSNSEYLRITHVDQTGLDITGSMTISCWIKGESFAASNSNGILTKWNIAAGVRSYMLRVYDSNLYFNVSSDGSASAQIIGSTNLSTATWYHVFAIYDGSNLYLYLNNSLDAAAVAYSSGIYNSSTSFNIGQFFNASTPSYFFDGLIDEPIIWNTALTEAERTTVYNITSYQRGGFQLWWGFCESWQRRNKLWTPKLAIPKEGYSY